MGELNSSMPEMRPKSGIQTHTSRSSGTRVQCSVPGCGKLFIRKEHLTRHLKTHDPERHYECPICRRRYARSDVLKRHVEHHSQDTGNSRVRLACASCHEWKLECEDAVPCGQCIRSSTECSRLTQNQQHGTNMGGSDTSNIMIDNDVFNENEELHTAGIVEKNSDSESALPHIDGQPPGSRSDQAAGSLPPFDIGINASCPDTLDITGLVQRTDTSASAVTGLRETYFILPASREDDSQTEFAYSPRLHNVSANEFGVFSPKSHMPSGAPNLATKVNTAELNSCLNKASPATLMLVQMYFAEIHPHWPILHAPTFDPCSASPVLLGAMVMLASWLEDGQDHGKLAPLVFDAISDILLECNTSHGGDLPPASVHTLQALLLCVVYTMNYIGSKQILAKAIQLNSTLISTCRYLGVFDGQYAYDVTPCPTTSWLAQEQLHRLAFSVLRVDAYLCILVNHPASVRHQEICIPAALWAAIDEEEQRTLQMNEPASGAKVIHSCRMRTFLDPGSDGHQRHHLTETDYHLILCSLQAGVWEAAREAYSCEADVFVLTSKPKHTVQLWRGYLESWRARVEKDCQLRQIYFSASNPHTEVFRPLSLILWHIAALMLHAPLKLLQGQRCCFNCRTETIMAKRSRIRDWSRSANARIAVWNAAQISRIIALESKMTTSTTHLKLNPLAISGLLKSAIVTCTYAYYTRACPVCTKGPPIDLVDLFGAKDDDARLVKWKEHAEGLADWVPRQIPVCGCKVLALAQWFRGFLARDEAVEIEFSTFVKGLSKT